MARRVCGPFNSQIFDCPAYSLVDSQKRNKLESKSKKCIFIGFTKRVKNFRLWDPEIRNAITSRVVVFNKESMLQEKSETEDKAQGGASNNLADTQKKRVEFSKRPKGLKGQKRTPQMQMEMNKKLLRATKTVEPVSQSYGATNKIWLGR